VAEDLSGTVLDGRYRLIRTLGVGGMGTVYEAEQVTLEKRVAVKVLKASLVSTGVHLERFLREAKSASKIRHRNVVDIMDFGRLVSGSAYYVMELLEGTDVAELLRAEGRLPWARTRAIVLQVLSALEAAHAEGVIHRDIKPANVFLLSDTGDQEDVIKVLDFGIAKVQDDRELTRADEIVGTATYMAPEQARGIVSERTDIYSVGILMYKMLTGRVPFRGANGFETLRLHQTESPPSMRQLVPDLSAAVEAVVLQALAKQPLRRFGSMVEMQAAVRSISPTASARARRVSVPHSPGPPSEQATLDRPVTPAVEVPVRDGSTARAPALERSPPAMLGAAGGTLEAAAAAGPTWTGTEGPPRTAESTATRRYRVEQQRRRLLLGVTAGLVLTAAAAVALLVAWAGHDPETGTPSGPNSAVVPSAVAPTPSARPDADASEPSGAGSTSSAAAEVDADADGPTPWDDPSLPDAIADTDEAGVSDESGGPSDGGSAADAAMDAESGETDPEPDGRDDGSSRPRPKPPTIASVKQKLVRRAKAKCRGLGTGKVAVTFTIRSDGGVMMIVPQSPHGSDDVGRCVAAVVTGARFPRGKMHQETITVRL
jgi:tRNA A-37 threonylcarbamoyl transferase component Bud32